MAATAVLELVAPGVIEEDLAGLEVALRDRGLEVVPALQRQVVRGQVAVEGATLVAGRLPFIRTALQRNGVTVPPPLDYVDAPRWVLGRAIWASTIGGVLAGLESRGEPVFLKPRGTAKRFTGRVVADPVDLRALGVTSHAAPVWCSEVVELVSEHRVFLARGEVVGVRHYDGDPAATLARSAVLEICDALRPSLPAGCALDVGLLADGRAVLVEANDGFSLGRYGLPAVDYLAVLLARWGELVGGSAPVS